MLNFLYAKQSQQNGGSIYLNLVVKLFLQPVLKPSRDKLSGGLLLGESNPPSRKIVLVLEMNNGPLESKNNEESENICVAHTGLTVLIE